MSGETFTGLLVPNLRPLRRLLERRLRIQGQADDVLQEAVLHAFARRDQLRVRSKFKSWLWTIAFNEMRLFFRSERSTISLDEFPKINPSDRAPSPLARVEQIEKLEWLHAGLAKLSERDRTAIRLRDLDGLSIAETAEALAISEGAVKSTHFRARKRLVYVLRGTSRPVVVEECRVLDSRAKHRVGNTTAAPLRFDSKCIDSTSERNRYECLLT